MKVTSSNDSKFWIILLFFQEEINLTTTIKIIEKRCINFFKFLVRLLIEFFHQFYSKYVKNSQRKSGKYLGTKLVYETE